MKCYSVFMLGEASDIAADYISARLTKMPNVIAVTKPCLNASFRADMIHSDTKKEQMKKYGAVSRNYKVSFKFVGSFVAIFSSSHIRFFKQIRDPRTQKYGKGFWCEAAWTEHQATLQHMADMQKADSKTHQVMLAVYLLAFPAGVKFSFKYCPEYVKSDGTIIGDKTNVFSCGEQVLTKIRWILPTDKATLVREDIRVENQDVTRDLLFSRTKIAEEDDFDTEGIVI